MLDLKNKSSDPRKMIGKWTVEYKPDADELLRHFWQLVGESFVRYDPRNCVLLPSTGLSIALSEIKCVFLSTKINLFKN